MSGSYASKLGPHIAQMVFQKHAVGYAAEEMTAADGEVIPADGLIEIISLDDNGKGTVRSDLPIGSYYVQEISTNDAYTVSDQKYPVIFEYAGQDIATVHISANDGNAIENEIIYGSVSGKKSDKDGNALGGALIGIFKTGTAEFTKETAIATAVSAEVVEIGLVNYFIKGNIGLTKVDGDYPENKLSGAAFEVYSDTNGDGKLDKDDVLLGTMTELEGGVYQMKELRYGKYLVREKTAPTGFALDENVYPVSIEENGKTYTVENKAGVGFMLSTDRRAIILLFYFLEMRDEEIGAELGLSRPAVQRRRTSTLDMLRKILEE